MALYIMFFLSDAKNKQTNKQTEKEERKKERKKNIGGGARASAPPLTGEHHSTQQTRTHHTNPFSIYIFNLKFSLSLATKKVLSLHYYYFFLLCCHWQKQRTTIRHCNFSCFSLSHRMTIGNRKIPLRYHYGTASSVLRARPRTASHLDATSSTSARSRNRYRHRCFRRLHLHRRRRRRHLADPARTVCLLVWHYQGSVSDVRQNLAADDDCDSGSNCCVCASDVSP